MKNTSRSVFVRLMLTVLICASAQAQASGPLFEDGDLVVMLGGTFIERAQEYGHIEAAIQRAYPDKTLHIRNLGWSGDTVWAESRGEFDPPAKGYERMIKQITEMKPDVIVFGYGNAEAFNGPQALKAFEQQYRKLINDLPETRRLVLGPVKPSDSFVGADAYRNSLAAYKDAVDGIAREYDSFFYISPDGGFEPSDYDGNRLHLNENGYRRYAVSLQTSLSGVDGLSPNTDSADAMRDAIIAKNRLVFYRWRPQNITYLALFRKHEQGNNYAEIPMFDPLIDEADQKIDKLKREIANSGGKINKEGRKAGS